MPDGRKIPTIIVADDELLREGLEQLADNLGLTVVNRARAIAEMAARPILPAEVELILVLEEPVARDSYFQALEEIRRQRPAARLVIFVNSLDAQLVCRAMDCGVDGMLSRRTSGQKLKHAIGLIMLGERLYPGIAALQALRSLPETQQEREGPCSFLTKREEEILRLLKAGYPNKLIANSLCTSEATVKVQVRRLFMKIGARNRTQAAIWSLHHLRDGDARQLPLPISLRPNRDQDLPVS